MKTRGTETEGLFSKPSQILIGRGSVPIDESRRSIPTISASNYIHNVLRCLCIVAYFRKRSFGKLVFSGVFVIIRVEEEGLV